MKKLMGFIILLVMILNSNPIPVKAGWLNGDEALGGFSYLLECAYQNKVPTGLYADLYYQAYHKFHYEIKLGESDKEILERIVEAEATGGNKAQKMNVASCVLARVQSNDWPDTLAQVVFQKTGKVYQFSPIGDGRYYSVKITDSTKDAVDEVLRHGLIHTCLFFCTKASYEKENSWHRKALNYKFYDGMHCYFEEDK